MCSGKNTCRRRIPVVVGLCVDHQAEAVAVPTCAVRPFDYLGAESSQGVEVNLSENVAYHVHEDCTKAFLHLKFIQSGLDLKEILTTGLIVAQMPMSVPVEALR